MVVFWEKGRKLNQNLSLDADSPWTILRLICHCQQFFLLFSSSVMSDSLQPHGLQHARLPCLSPSLRVCTNSCPLSWWCHPTISSSIAPFSSCPQSFPASGSFPMSWLFESDSQSIGVSTSILPISTNLTGSSQKSDELRVWKWHDCVHQPVLFLNGYLLSRSGLWLGEMLGLWGTL